LSGSTRHQLEIRSSYRPHNKRHMCQSLRLQQVLRRPSLLRCRRPANHRHNNSEEQRRRQQHRHRVDINRLDAPVAFIPDFAVRADFGVSPRRGVKPASSPRSEPVSASPPSPRSDGGRIRHRRHRRDAAEPVDHDLRRRAHYFGPIVPVSFSRADLTQPVTLCPLLEFRYITDDHPSLVSA
jgi:hypothetical protein